MSVWFHALEGGDVLYLLVISAGTYTIVRDTVRDMVKQWLGREGVRVRGCEGARARECDGARE